MSMIRLSAFSGSRLSPLSLLSVAGACAHVKVTDVDVRSSRFAQHADSLRAALRIPGLAVVALHDTTVVLARGFGLANLARNTRRRHLLR